MPKPDSSHHYARKDRGSEERVRDAAMVLELLDRTSEGPQHVDVGSLGG
jgi:hypothetical protein